MTGIASTFPFKAVIFDMDGVIVDTEIEYMKDQVRFFEEYGIHKTVEDLFETAGTSHQFFCSYVREHLATVGIDVTPEGAWDLYRAWSREHPWDFRSLMNPGVPETLAALRRRGVRVALASSSPMATIEKALTACGIDSQFELIVSGEQFEESKPDPQIYLHTMAALGLTADECCCIEDSLPGITAGKAAGLTVIAKREDRFGFSQEAADAIIDEIPELIEAALALRA